MTSYVVRKLCEVSKEKIECFFGLGRFLLTSNQYI